VTVVLGVLVGVAVVALAGSLLAWRSASRRLAAAGAQLVDTQGELEASRQAEESTREELTGERRRGSEAEKRAEDAEQRAGRAEHRATDAESAVAALISARSPALLAEIERVRLEREWKEVAGPDAGLPVRWDGSLHNALAVELEIIREVTGTPGRLEQDGEGAGAGADEASVWVLGALGCELLRVVARYADEVVVRLEAAPGMAPAIVAEGLRGSIPAELSSIEMGAKALGVSLEVEQAGDGFVATLSAESRLADPEGSG
jgi:hypothetical protein